MKRMILTGTLALATGLTPLMLGQQQTAPPKQQPAAPPKQQQPQLVPNTKSPGESNAVVAMMQAQGNPDAMIKAVEDLLTNYADTSWKGTALRFEADAYQSKGDVDKAQIFGMRALEVDPKDFQAELMVGELLARKTRENDLDKEEKLTQADKFLNGAIRDITAAQKPNPQLTDEQWTQAKNQIIGEAHSGLGMAALVRKKFDVAITEFKTAAETDAQPAYLVQLASAYNSAGKFDEAIATCDKVLADPQLHPRIKEVATNIKAIATKAKK